MNGELPRARALLERRTVAEATPVAEKPSEPEYTAYANGRVGSRPQLLLLFRKLDGSVRAFSYSHLYAVTSDDPAAGFTVEFTKSTVTVRGVNLTELFRMICQQRVHELAEASRNQLFDLADTDAAVHSVTFQ